MRFRALAILATTALVPVAATAQTSPAQQPRPTAPGAQAQQQRAISASEFVNRVAMNNLFEIESGRLAQERAQDPELRQFAQRLVQDHTQLSERLRAAAQNQTPPSNLDQEHQQRLQRLQNASGADFDRRYLQMQLTSHQQAVALFENYAQNGDDPQLRQLAQQRLPTLRDHLQTAQRMHRSGAPNQMGATQDRGQQGNQTQGNQTQARNRGDGQAQDDRSRIVVQQSSPAVSVDQAAPQVRVQQPQPRVTVRQQQPEIIVRQAAPTITVQQPQPEIIVRMPEPDVDVSMAQPQVEVDQPQPQVQVAPPQQQPQVQVQRGEPRVTVQPTQREANVQFQREGQRPNVRFERSGEPRVVYQESQGEPRIRYEQMNGERGNQQGRQARSGEEQRQGSTVQEQGQGSTMQQEPSAQQQRSGTQQRELTEEQRRNVRARLGAGEADGTAGATSANVPRRAMTADQIENLDVYNLRGERLGNVGAVVVDPRNQPYVVVEHGGFLGIGEDRVALPLERFWLRGDRIFIRGVTEDDIEAMAEYREAARNYGDVGGDSRLELKVWQ